MSDLTVARRYAQALHQETATAGSMEATDQDVAQIRAALVDSPELTRFFGSPVISRQKKKSVVDALFADRIGPLPLRMIHLLVEKRREAEVSAVMAAYQAIRDDEEGIAEVSVRSARSLSDEDQKAIASSLEKRLSKRIRLSVSSDESLIGGVVVQVGDTVYDGSVSNRLASLRERMMESALLN
jgi:F-type H+-transporting ATPase subunit delta